MKPLILTIAGTALIAGLLGYGLGWKVSQPTPGKLDPPAQKIKQADGSVVLARQPDPAAKPKQVLPRGAKVERVVSVEVMPRTSGPSPEGKESPRPVTVDLTLVRMPDQTRRVIASSPDGEIVGGLDVPVEAPPVPRVPKWSVSALAGFDTHQMRPVYGAKISRSAGAFVFEGGFIGQTAFVGLGARW